MKSERPGIGNLRLIDPPERVTPKDHGGNDGDGKDDNTDAEKHGLTHGRPASPLRMSDPAERIDGTQMPTNTPCI